MTPKIVIVTQPSDPHADAVIRELHKRSFPVFRFHPEDFPNSINISCQIRNGKLSGEILTKYHRLEIDQIHSIWYRRPQKPKLSTNTIAGGLDYIQTQCNSLINALYFAVDTFWVSDPAKLKVAEVKALQLIRAAQVGFQTPDTLISNDIKHIQKFCEVISPHYQIAIKAINAIPTHTPDGMRLPFTTILPSDIDLSNRHISICPTVFQPYLEKGGEVRCIVIGNKLFPVKITPKLVTDDATDWRTRHVVDENLNLIDNNRYELIELPKVIEKQIHQLMNGFGIVFAAIDMIITPNGEYFFLELNPNGQWLWLEDELGIPLTKTMADLLIDRSAARNL